ncbi:Salmolysin [Hartmannibacter diazotrophicus]|uniref:Salmolysin n=1 Tax=Hartmannibacter diazotrophicus TaxID=1482074 RepID=A0A2C9DB20_9HYPH|nr:MarR family transcriptional regulator [Hartmannibacter diazotrophicus]SON57328.1 Salmolysin [Hartmannibacter diazotrophicus]
MKLSSQPLGFLFVDVARLFRRSFEQALAEAGLGLTSGEARTLARCGRYKSVGGIRQAVLADVMSVEPMTLVGYLDRLEKAGLVGRFPDPSDRRAKLVRVLPKGEPVLRRVEEIGQKVRLSAIEGLSPDQIETLQDALEHICDRLSVYDAGK